MKEILDIYYTEEKHPMQMLDLYLPDAESFPVFIYFHGGGLENEDRLSGAESMKRLAAHGVAAVAVDYRKYPEVQYPAFIEDCAAAVAWVKKNIANYGNAEGLYVGGSSAGGYLSMMLCFDEKYLGAVGVDPSEIAGWFHDAGQPTKHFTVLKYDGEDARRVIVDETAPLYHIGKAKKYAPMRFIVSDNDIDGRYEQIMLVLSTLKHFGHTNFDCKLMHGSHCHYCDIVSPTKGILGEMVLDFLKNLPK